MRRFFPVVLGTLVLGGCALPANVQVISWALDGFSYLVTGKSVTDHGLSIVTRKDCALWRLVTEDEVCREEDAITVMASADVAPAGSGANSETGVATSTSEFWSNPATAEELSVIEVSVMDPVPEALPPRKPAIVAAIDTTPTLTPGSFVEMASAGDYLVIGSFSKRGNAREFAEKNGRFETKTLSAVVSGKRVYRVVVGPVVGSDRHAVASSLLVAGLVETWSLNVPEALATVAWRTVPATQPTIQQEQKTQLASLPSGTQ